MARMSPALQLCCQWSGGEAHEVTQAAGPLEQRLVNQASGHVAAWGFFRLRLSVQEELDAD